MVASKKFSDAWIGYDNVYSHISVVQQQAAQGRKKLRATQGRNRQRKPTEETDRHGEDRNRHGSEINGCGGETDRYLTEAPFSKRAQVRKITGKLARSAAVITTRLWSMEFRARSSTGKSSTEFCRTFRVLSLVLREQTTELFSFAEKILLLDGLIDYLNQGRQSNFSC